MILIYNLPTVKKIVLLAVFQSKIANKIFDKINQKIRFFSKKGINLLSGNDPTGIGGRYG
jgi:hypothetical protein